MSKKTDDTLPYAASVTTGLVICLAVTMLTGRREAWDSAYYFTAGIPLMCVVMFAISYRYPVRAWRWPLSMAVGQSVAMTIGGGSLSLWPLSIIAMTVVSIPQFVTALLAARLVARRGEP